MAHELFKMGITHVDEAIRAGIVYGMESTDILKVLKAEMEAEKPESFLHSDYRYLVARIRTAQDHVRKELHPVSHGVLVDLKAAEDCLKRESLSRWSVATSA